MRKQNYIYYYIFLILFFLAVACKVQQKTAEVTPVVDTTTHAPAKTLSKNEQIQLEAQLILAHERRMLGNYDEARTLLLDIIKKDNRNAAAMYELARIYYTTGQFNEALQYARNAASLQPKNKWYQKLYAEVLMQRNRFRDAAKVFELLVQTFPNDYTLYFDWAYALLGANDFAEAIRVYDLLEEQVGIEETIVLQKRQLYEHIGKMDKAAAEIQKLIKAFPKDLRYQYILGQLYELNNQAEKAFEVYRKMLEQEPDNPQARLGLAGYYKNKGDRQRYMHEMKLAFANPELSIDTKIKDYLLPYIEILNQQPELIEEAIVLSRLLTEAHPLEAKAYAMHGDFLRQNNQLQEALAMYKKALQLDPSVFTLWQQTLFVYAEIQEYDSLIFYANEALSYFPNQPIIYYLKSVGLLQKKRYEETIQILEKGLTLYSENKTLLSQIHANLGEAYYHLKNYPSADHHFELALQYDPKNVYVLNNYSYYLALRNEKLLEAEKMAKKANELSPNNSAFEDTYAWVLYKLGRYEEARQWLEKALRNGGNQRPVVVEHYGDILYRLGEVDQAVEQWRQAKELGFESEWLNKKIRDRTLYE